jgi:purine-binding chemotaxis protein CheW
VSAPTLLFRVGGRLYGCDITEAQEIIPLRPTTRLPGAPPFVRGLINMRGTIVTVLDLGARLDAANGPTRDGSILLVRHGEHGDRLVGLVVEEVADVRVLDIDASDPTAAGAPPSIVKGMAAIENEAGGEAVVVLDLPVLIKQVLL